MDNCKDTMLYLIAFPHKVASTVQGFFFIQKTLANVGQLAILIREARASQKEEFSVSAGTHSILIAISLTKTNCIHLMAQRQPLKTTAEIQIILLFPGVILWTWASDGISVTFLSVTV